MNERKLNKWKKKERTEKNNALRSKKKELEDKNKENNVNNEKM